jgi:hypothetical protein
LDGWFAAADGLLKAEPSASPMRDHLRLRCGSTIGLISLGDVPGAMFSVDIRDQKCAHFTKSQDVSYLRRFVKGMN